MWGGGDKALVRFTVNTASGEEIKLEVGSHSPVWVIKEELERATSIEKAGQVLCLMNDKGDEGELLEDDEATITRVGIQNGSCLFLSCLSNPSPPPRRPAKKKPVEAPLATDVAPLIALDDEEVDRRARDECRAWCAEMSKSRCRAREEEQAVRDAETLGEPDSAAPAEITDANPPVRKLLTTQKTPQRAEHSFNGVMFDVEAKGSYEVVLDSVHIGGMLGHMRVYACRSGSWTGDPTSVRRNRGYGHQYDVRDEEHWDLVANVRCKPMWNSTTEVLFDEKVRLLPGQRRALYVHSALPDDLGLQYQTTGGNEQHAVDEDEFVALYPGVGHTSSTPFDRDYGWYRHPRCLAGKLGYSARLRTWTPKYHNEFPDPLKEAVRTMLLAQQRGGCSLSKLPVDLVFQVMEKCEWEHFGSGAPPIADVESSDDEEYQTEFEQQVAALRRHHGATGPMMRVEVEGRQVDVPMNILLLLMGHHGGENPFADSDGSGGDDDDDDDDAGSDFHGSSTGEDDDDNEQEQEEEDPDDDGDGGSGGGDVTFEDAAAELDDDEPAGGEIEMVAPPAVAPGDDDEAPVDDTAAASAADTNGAAAGPAAAEAAAASTEAMSEDTEFATVD